MVVVVVWLVSFRLLAEPTSSPLVSTSTRDPPLEMQFGQGRATRFVIPARFYLPASARDKSPIFHRALLFHSTRQTPKNPLSGGSLLCSLPTLLHPANQTLYINTAFSVLTNHDKVVIIKQALTRTWRQFEGDPISSLFVAALQRQRTVGGESSLYALIYQNTSLHLQTRSAK